MSSKKHRKKIKSFYQMPQGTNGSGAKEEEKNSGVEELNEKHEEEQFNEIWREVRGFRIDFPIKERIESFMKGDLEFIIYLTLPVQGKFVGALQVGNFNSKLEVFPKVDDFKFFEKRKGKTENLIAYIRRYSDFPPSVSFFSSDQVEKIETKVKNSLKTI